MARLLKAKKVSVSPGAVCKVHFVGGTLSGIVSPLMSSAGAPRERVSLGQSSSEARPDDDHRCSVLMVRGPTFSHILPFVSRLSWPCFFDILSA
jgi:hypothetical protein